VITLHEPSGKPIYIFAKIDVIWPAEPGLNPGAGAVIQCAGRFEVRETPQQILKLIEQSGR
jgi:ribonucleotide monophosphatase NagD (HAD superfamily)